MQHDVAKASAHLRSVDTDVHVIPRDVGILRGADAAVLGLHASLYHNPTQAAVVPGADARSDARSHCGLLQAPPMRTSPGVANLSMLLIGSRCLAAVRRHRAEVGHTPSELQIAALDLDRTPILASNLGRNPVAVAAG